MISLNLSFFTVDFSHYWLYFQYLLTINNHYFPRSHTGNLGHRILPTSCSNPLSTTFLTLRTLRKISRVNLERSSGKNRYALYKVLDMTYGLWLLHDLRDVWQKRMCVCGYYLKWINNCHYLILVIILFCYYCYMIFNNKNIIEREL